VELFYNHVGRNCRRGDGPEVREGGSCGLEQELNWRVDESSETADEKLGVATISTNELPVISTDEQYCTGGVRSVT
jgi:hypothetical protein